MKKGQDKKMRWSVVSLALLMQLSLIQQSCALKSYSQAPQLRTGQTQQVGVSGANDMKGFTSQLSKMEQKITDLRMQQQQLQKLQMPKQQIQTNTGVNNQPSAKSKDKVRSDASVLPAPVSQKKGTPKGYSPRWSGLLPKLRSPTIPTIARQKLTKDPVEVDVEMITSKCGAARTARRTLWIQSFNEKGETHMPIPLNEQALTRDSDLLVTRVQLLSDMNRIQVCSYDWHNIWYGQIRMLVHSDGKRIKFIERSLSHRRVINDKGRPEMCRGHPISGLYGAVFRATGETAMPCLMYALDVNGQSQMLYSRKDQILLGSLHYYEVPLLMHEKISQIEKQEVRARLKTTQPPLSDTKEEEEKGKQAGRKLKRHGNKVGKTKIASDEDVALIKEVLNSKSRSHSSNDTRTTDKGVEMKDPKSILKKNRMVLSNNTKGVSKQRLEKIKNETVEFVLKIHNVRCNGISKPLEPNKLTFHAFTENNQSLTEIKNDNQEYFSDPFVINKKVLLPSMVLSRTIDKEFKVKNIMRGFKICLGLGNKEETNDVFFGYIGLILRFNSENHMRIREQNLPLHQPGSNMKRRSNQKCKGHLIKSHPRKDSVKRCMIFEIDFEKQSLLFIE